MERLLVIGIVVATALTGCNRQPPKQAAGAAEPQRKLTIPSAAPPAAPPAGETPVLKVGRYLIVHNQHDERETMLLDTATGKTWELTEFPELKGSPMGWEEVPRLDTLQDWESFVASHHRKVKPP